MSLKQRIYSVLIVSASESFIGSLANMLPESRYNPQNIVSSITSAKRAVLERTYDFVIINSPISGEDATRFAIDLCSFKNTVVLLLVRSEIYDEIFDKVAEHGVYAIQKPVSRGIMSAALDWMSSTIERLRKTEIRTLSLEEKMEEIRVVNRAKWLLIGELKMSEAQAHRYIEKQAMDRCVTRREVAESIIGVYS